MIISIHYSGSITYIILLYHQLNSYQGSKILTLEVVVLRVDGIK